MSEPTYAGSIELRLDESQRQIVLLAIGRLAVERPGWDGVLQDLADLLHGRQMFESFKSLKREEVGSETSLPTSDQPG